MNFLGLLLVTALVGISSCDIVCMQFKLSTCFARMALRSVNPICGAHVEFTECLRSGAQECNVESSQIVKDVIDTYTTTCVPGTEMNRLYRKHRQCVFTYSALETAACLRPVIREIMALGFPTPDKEYKIKTLKIACGHAETGNQCIDDNINRTCGEEAYRFRSQLSGASVELSNQACREIGEENNDINHASEQHNDYTVITESPNNHHHFAATAPQVANLYLATTVAPNYEIMSGATSNVALGLIHTLAVIFMLKLLSPF